MTRVCTGGGAAASRATSLRAETSSRVGWPMPSARDVGARVRRAERDQVLDDAVAAGERDVVAADDAAHRVADQVDLGGAGRRAHLVDEPAELARRRGGAAERPVLEAEDRPEPGAARAGTRAARSSRGSSRSRAARSSAAGRRPRAGQRQEAGRPRVAETQRRHPPLGERDAHRVLAVVVPPARATRAARSGYSPVNIIACDTAATPPRHARWRTE